MSRIERLTSERREGVSAIMEMEKALYKRHPALFKSRPVTFVLNSLLILVSVVWLFVSLGQGHNRVALLPLALLCVGLVILVVWGLKTLGAMLTITDKRTVLRRGIFSKYTSEILHTNVRNIQLYQSLMHRIFNVGNIGISSAGQSGVEIEVSGVPEPEKVKDIIDEYRVM